MDATKRAVFLRKIHLFHDLSDDQLLEIAEKFDEVYFESDQVILEQGVATDSFYIIYSGKVRLFQQWDGREQDLVTLVSGDYVGEMELFGHQGRTASGVASEPSLLLRLSKQRFEELLKTYSSLKPTLEVSIESRRLARKLHFKWLGKDEVVYFLARKHPVFLARMLAGPIAFFLVPVFLFVWGWLAQSTAALVFGSVALAFFLGWGAWSVVDWGNDYYIVTNQRAIWLEKVVGLYDSRAEAPLDTILSVGVETDITGRILDYGNVIVRTFVGAIPFMHVHHPHQAAHMVEEYWQRTKQVSTDAENAAFKTALRQRLGLLQPSEDDLEIAPEQEEPTFPPLYKPGLFKIMGANLFKLRFEEGQTITYRKHWYVLIRQVWMPTVTLLALLGFTIARLIRLMTTPGLSLLQHMQDGKQGVDTLIVSMFLLMAPVVLWWIYQYIDWSNDIYQVTSDQVIDIDRKPFGTEERRAAPLDNILSTQYKREGFAGYLFNYGTVFITIGGAQLAFEDVIDPAGVQSDIDRRRMARMAAKKKAELTAERDRIADWMATYHQNVDDFWREQELKDTKPKNE